MIFFGSKKELILELKKEIIKDIGMRIHHMVSDGINTYLLGQDIFNEVDSINQKFDALAKAVGVVVVSDLSSINPHAVIASIKNNRKANKAKEYLQIIVLDKKLAKLKADLVSRMVEDLREEVSNE